MTDESWTAIGTAFFANLPTLVTSLTALIIAIRSKNVIRVLKEDINSRMSEWMRNAQSTSHAEGHAEGVEAERARTDRHGAPAADRTAPKVDGKPTLVTHRRRRTDRHGSH